MEQIPVSVLSQDGRCIAGMAEVVTRSPAEAFRKGALRAAKIVGTLSLTILPFGLLEPFLFLIWGSISLSLLVLVVGPYLHLKFASETRSFSSVRSECPYCGSKEPLTPYLSTRFDREFAVLCPACGQKSRVIC